MVIKYKKKKSFQRKIFVCEIRILANSADSAFDGLSALFSEFTVTNRPNCKSFVIKKYCDSRKDAEKALTTLKDGTQVLRACEIRILSSRIIPLPPEDWTEKWKKHFKVMKMGRHIVVKPSWLKYRSKKNDILIEIDPGMSFGTGKHDTTRFCLDEIERARNKSQKQSFLDAGCGSGILSIAAVKLAYSEVFSFDNDSEAIITTKENMARNSISAKFAKVRKLELEKTADLGKFDVVVANIISDVLIKNSQKLRSLVKKGGSLVLAGICDEDKNKVLSAFDGFSILRQKSSHGWTGLHLKAIT